jgi:hypothetical protein
MDFLKLIQEGRVDDFKAKYSQKFGGENVNKIVNSVPQKYLDWVGKNLDVVNFDETFGKVSNALNKFEKISSNLPITDLTQYKSVGQLFGAISDYEGRQRRNVKKVEGGNVVYDDGKYFVVNPLTHESSCYYGKGTKWCTAAESDYNFKRYNDDGKLFYILDRTLPTNDPFYKVALLRKFDGDKTFFFHERLYKPMNEMPGTLSDKFDELGLIKNKENIADSGNELNKSEGQKLKNSGYNIIFAQKGHGSINAGIETLQKCNVYYTASSINLEQEYENYSWKVWQGIQMDVPEDNCNDHALDCCRMGVSWYVKTRYLSI